MTKTRGKAAYMISAVAEQYAIHPQTLRLYEREGLLAPSRSEGNTRLYTDEDLERLEIILKLTRELGVNLAGVEIILNMREKMEAMQKQMEGFIETLNEELSQRAAAPQGMESHSLMPVIQMHSLTRSEGKRKEGEGRGRDGRGSGQAVSPAIRNPRDKCSPSIHGVRTHCRRIAYRCTTARDRKRVPIRPRNTDRRA